MIEAAYRLNQHESVWLRGVREALAPVLGAPAGIVGVTYGLEKDRVVGRCLDVTGPPGRTNLLHLIGSGHLARFAAAWKGTVTAYSSGLPRRKDVEGIGPELGLDFREGFGIHSEDPAGAGVVLAIPLPIKARPRRLAESSRWERIAAHIAAGFRAHRRAFVGMALDAEAVLDQGGRLLDARGPAAEKTARALLKTACLTVDRARTSAGRADPASLERWTSLFGARWSLLDRFDRDGRRFIIAVRNVVTDEAKPLTPREAQVVALVALGHHNKLISYELGLAFSTVRVLLQRAARKLGCRTRAEVEAKAATLQLGDAAGLVPAPPEGRK